MNALLGRCFVAATLSTCGVVALAYFHERVTAADIVLIAAIASVLASIAASFLRSPRQFRRALFERCWYCIVVPLCVAAMVALLLLRVFFLLFKLSLKLIIWLVVSAAYLFFPIDLIPDLIIGLGQIDDLIVFVSIGFWAFSAGAKDELRSVMRVSRPVTPFP